MHPLQVTGAPHSTWDRVSAHYDRQRWLEEAAVRRAVELLAARPRERVLDVGTGTGLVLRRLARVGAGPQVTGVDLSREMLARVRDLPAGWSVRQADARSLPFPGGHFDAAVASYLIHVLDPVDVPVVADELARVLRRGGRLATVTPAIPPGGAMRRPAIALDRLAHRHPGRFGGLRALDPRPALERAGLEVLTARWSLRGYPSLCVLARHPVAGYGARRPGRPSRGVNPQGPGVGQTR